MDQQAQVDLAAKTGGGKSELRTIVAMSVPTVAITASRTVVSFTDMAMVSRLGTEAAAALMPANLVIFSLIALGMGMMTAVNTFTSQSLGRGRPEDGARYAVQALLISLCFGLVALPLLPVMPVLVKSFGHAPGVAHLEVEYTRIALLSVGPSIGAMAMAYYFVGLHHPRISMYASLFEVVANLAGNYALIFGHWGFPELGVPGCAWSTVVASSSRLLFLLIWFWSGRYRREYKTATALGVDWSKTAGLVRVGLPVGVGFSLELVCWTVFINYLVGRFGTAHLAANNFVFQYLHISFMPAVGIGMAMSALVGKAVGQRDYRLATHRSHLGMAFCVGWMGTCGAAFLLFREPLMRFWTDDPQVISLGMKLMICCAVFQVFDGLGISTTAALRGAGDTFRPNLYNALYSWSVMVLGGWLMARVAPQWTSVGLWAMASSFIILVALTLWIRFERGSWKRIDIFGEQEEAGTEAEEVASGLDRNRE